MIKHRIVPTLLFKDVGLVKGVRFDSWRRTGSAMQAVKVYDLREVDELIFLDIQATTHGRPPDYATIAELATECFVPFTVGGGIRTLEHVREVLKAGADKIALNSAAAESPRFVREVADHFGSQCVVVSIDARRQPDETYRAYSRCGTHELDLDPVTLARNLEAEGAGEILITSIDRDGTMEGYDVELIAAISQAVKLPVIASGGAGSYADMAAAISKGGATAVAAASLFHFTENTPLGAKLYLRDRGIPVRL